MPHTQEDPVDTSTLFKIGASGLAAERARMETISANIANANATRTPDGGPYRRRVPVFESVNFADAYQNAQLQESTDAMAVVRVKDVVLDKSPLPRVYDPGHPDADPDGYVAMPNVNTVQEMVDMLSASRSYEANLAAVETTRDLAQAAIDIAGR